MQKIAQYWCLLLLLGFALVVNENFVQWMLAVKVGGYGIGAGFKDAYEYFTPLGYLFLTAFRIVPYVGLAGALFGLSRTEAKEYCLPVFFGALLGILAMLVWGFWVSMKPYYTDEHVSSTTAIAFLFIPFYAIPAGAAGGALASAIYTPFYLMSSRRRR